ncbi:hypothetical protein VNO77_02789 [Canavalia gladiata]|uniref:Uncharacterized protein n=1 Tax=Canavalia gladiata TaxID=3824 RepID=A0AAN9MVP3_CANGL
MPIEDWVVSAPRDDIQTSRDKHGLRCLESRSPSLFQDINTLGYPCSRPVGARSSVNAGLFLHVRQVYKWGGERWLFTRILGLEQQDLRNGRLCMKWVFKLK